MNAALLQWAIVRYRSGNCALLGWLGETASMQATESFSGELTSVEPRELPSALMEAVVRQREESSPNFRTAYIKPLTARPPCWLAGFFQAVHTLGTCHQRQSRFEPFNLIQYGSI
jgi:hypothetical protein